MKIYQVMYSHADEGALSQWYETKKKAVRAIGQMEKSPEIDPGSIEMEKKTVPTDKVGLTLFLNAWAARL